MNTMGRHQLLSAHIPSESRMCTQETIDSRDGRDSSETDQRNLCYLRGAIDELRVYDRPLSEAEVRAIFAPVIFSDGFE